MYPSTVITCLHFPVVSYGVMVPFQFVRSSVLVDLGRLCCVFLCPFNCAVVSLDQSHHQVILNHAFAMILFKVIIIRSSRALWSLRVRKFTKLQNAYRCSLTRLKPSSALPFPKVTPRTTTTRTFIYVNTIAKQLNNRILLAAPHHRRVTVNGIVGAGPSSPSSEYASTCSLHIDC